jgi:HEAT repeat protein
MMTINMLDQDSPSARIKTINQIKNLSEIDDAIITALLHTLNNDPNLNVRLVTVELLIQFCDNNRIREGLIYSITKQESPLIQIALIDLMVGIKERAAIAQFKELLEKKDLNDVVRTRIEENLKLLI